MEVLKIVNQISNTTYSPESVYIGLYPLFLVSYFHSPILKLITSNPLKIYLPIHPVSLFVILPLGSYWKNNTFHTLSEEGRDPPVSEPFSIFLWTRIITFSTPYLKTQHWEVEWNTLKMFLGSIGTFTYFQSLKCVLLYLKLLEGVGISKLHTMSEAISFNWQTYKAGESFLDRFYSN